MVARATESPSVVREVERAVQAALAGRRVVLAVSGGRDSMALLHAASRVARHSIAHVATFDHGTGPAARRAAAFVASEAMRLRLPLVIGHAAGSLQPSEGHWREARHAFLRDVADRVGADIATAHTRDDQLETVFMRVLRDTGARGLAALYAEQSGFVRPLIDVSRTVVAGYVRVAGLAYLEDPANESLRFLRNRVRHELLPALTHADPSLPSKLLDLAREAARWRSRVDALAAAIVREASRGLIIDAAVLSSLAPRDAALLWPAVAARAGLAMDWRGTERAAEFTSTSTPGSRMPLSGGWTIVRTRDSFELLEVPTPVPLPVRPLRPGTRVDAWRFVATRKPSRGSNEWVARLPRHATLTVRSWQPGDRMRLAGGLRKVKRFLSDARISGTRRGQWPVVLAGDEIVWIPGVRRGDAATLPVRPGRPWVWYRCELDDR